MASNYNLVSPFGWLWFVSNLGMSNFFDKQGRTRVFA